MSLPAILKDLRIPPEFDVRYVKGSKLWKASGIYDLFHPRYPLLLYRIIINERSPSFLERLQAKIDLNVEVVRKMIHRHESYRGRRR